MSKNQKRKLKGTTISFIVGFILGIIFTGNVEISFVIGILFIFIFFFIESGELSRLMKHLKANDERRAEEKRAYQRRQVELKKIREDEMEKEIGRKKAHGEYLRREEIKQNKEGLRREQVRKNRDFFNNPLGIGK
ncbi:MAG: hypothetical protein PHD05_07875 [Sphaerochaetaceae bacterium]|nr:hypothetical protein [Sphaerochaetaceae bacterium]